MIQDIDFSNLEYVSAVKNISTEDDIKYVTTTITFLRKEDSIAHLTGLEKTFAELKLQEESKYIKLASVYTTVEDVIQKDEPIKVIFSGINKKYRQVTRSETDENMHIILNDIQFVDMVFDRSENKHVYMQYF